MSHDELGTTLMRPVVVPGDGSTTRLVAALVDAGELAVSAPCTVCGESESPGWVPGYAPSA
jgi:hypothetical protein